MKVNRKGSAGGRGERAEGVAGPGMKVECPRGRWEIYGKTMGDTQFILQRGNLQPYLCTAMFGNESKTETSGTKTSHTTFELPVSDTGIQGR